MNQWLSRLEAAKLVTGIKTDKWALKSFNEFLEFLQKPNPIYHLESSDPHFAAKVKFADGFWGDFCSFLQRKYPAYKKLLRSQAQKKNRKNLLN